ncbi:mannitol dehydrogenase family protein [Cellulomonas sp. ATA003]|uniref:mannitol dehydrogenase family protein n=1 Tax=Cellulomonas sp. ATA003 TaxID=3073064 RepID=UPI002872D2C2|nr:mannitol dehydrogenase family protein [Cellulomonas sp. ATA003]WNB87399.1 mannitol dehydrogenase family protein [Cellulomonas sp. ATA003]
MPRLSLGTLESAGSAARPSGASADATVQPPAVDPRTTGIGIVHLGVGAFHRAHQAVFTEEAAAAAGEDRWGILGVTGRSPRVAEQLAPQDGLYGVLTKGRESTSLRVIGSMRGAASLGDESERVLTAIAAPTTHIVSSTVSEKGYRRNAAGGPDLTNPDLAADIAALTAELSGRDAGAPARTPIGALVRGLARRQRAHGAPLTVVCCDNMMDNGRVVAGLVAGILDAAGGADAARVRSWVEESVRFPVTMVDRITPATTEAHQAEASALSGWRDEALVVAEPFTQWVVEDLFAGPRPRWELVPGATLTDDVAPYERAKLRMLNGSHSAVAYLGALRGHRLIDQAMLDAEVAGLARRLLDEDVIPTLTPPADLDLAHYRDDILDRYANPATGYTTLQVAGDGSQKVPIRLISTVADRLAAGSVPAAATRAVAAWVVFVARGRDVNGQDLPLDDPLADRLREVAAGDDAGLADRMLGIHEVFSEPVREHDGFRSALRSEVADLLGTVPAR